jgi:hypothetical protein
MAAVQTLDLDSVKVRIMDPHLGEGWTREYAESIEHAYKNYLTMLIKYPEDAEDILLSKDVDEFWHTHILQTLKYTNDCDTVFGTYLHHAPHIGEITREDEERRVAQAERTLQLYRQEFGDERNSAAAWYGIAATANFDSTAANDAAMSPAIVTANAAVSAATMARDAAVSAATMARDAAVSAATIARDAAVSAATMARDAAVSAATIARDAAVSAATMPAISAAIRVESIRV